MKKVLALLCVLILLLTACGAPGPETGASPEAENEEKIPASEADSAAAEEGEEIIVVEENAEEGETLVNLDDFLGVYADDSYNEVRIETNGENYTMDVSLYRLTSLTEGAVSPSAEGVVFQTVDANGNPMTVSFYRDGDDSYALRVDESTWLLLEAGTVFGGMRKTA